MALPEVTHKIGQLSRALQTRETLVRERADKLAEASAANNRATELDAEIGRMNQQLRDLWVEVRDTIDSNFGNGT